jgi:hypothetical protein
LKHRIAFCAVLAALGVAATMATPVRAQTIYGEPPPSVEPMAQPMPPPMAQPGLPPNEVLMIVRTSGLRPLTQPARQGPNWVLLASDNMGGQLRVVVSAQSGRIVHASPAHDPRFAYAPVRPRGLVPNAPPEHMAAMPPPPATYSAPPADLRTPTAPPPSPPRTARAAPAPQTPPATSSRNPSLAGAPDATGSVPTRPARTPLPRPRPAIAANEAAAPAAPAPVQARPVETSPEAEPPAAAQPAAAAPSAAPAKPAPTETQMVPVAPLD